MINQVYGNTDGAVLQNRYFGMAALLCYSIGTPPRCFAYVASILTSTISLFLQF
jgi:hypothetical protein